MFQIRRYVRDGERSPWGYGFAWYDWDGFGRVCYPIPLNWIAGWLHRLWAYLAWGPECPFKPYQWSQMLRERDARIFELESRNESLSIRLAASIQCRRTEDVT